MVHLNSKKRRFDSKSRSRIAPLSVPGYYIKLCAFRLRGCQSRGCQYWVLCGDLKVHRSEERKDMSILIRGNSATIPLSEKYVWNSLEFRTSYSARPIRLLVYVKETQLHVNFRTSMQRFVVIDDLNPSIYYFAVEEFCSRHVSPSDHFGPESIVFFNGENNI